MKFLIPIILLLSISEKFLGKEIGREERNYDDELSYQELLDLKVFCYPSDSCSWKDKKYDLPIPGIPHACSCHSQCWEYGTCCIDSPYTVKLPLYKCINVGILDFYFMVLRCPDNTSPDNIWKIHCEREWDNENDILMLSPVTSLDTSRTYKNYYCFRCHEATNKYLLWNLKVTNIYKTSPNASVHSVTYNQTEMTWMAILDKNPISIPVNLSFEFPHDVQTKPTSCYTLSEISDCPETWTDKSVQEKCLRYKAVVYKNRLMYRNVHCALCNSVSPNDLSCHPSTNSTGNVANYFQCLIDVSGGEEGKCFNKDEGTCEKDNHVWNPYTKECQEMKCVLPGYVVKDNVCAKP